MPKRDEILEKMMRKATSDDSLRLTVQKYGTSIIFTVHTAQRANAIQFELPMKQISASARQGLVSIYQYYLKHGDKS